MKHTMLFCRLLLAPVLLTGSLAFAQEPKLLEVKKIWDKGKHNAFTDLTRWRDKWYCVFREAEAHVGGDGEIRVLESADGVSWTSAALIAEKDIDLRDPHLSVTPDDRLMIVAGGSVYKGTKKLMGRQPRVMFSRDGKTWTAPERVLQEGAWLWRVTWHDGKAYGVSYNAAARNTKAAQEAAKETKPVSGDPADWKLQLVVSDDGVNYTTITHLGVPGNPNETTLRFLKDGALMAMVRREAGNTMGWLGTSKAPYKEWQWSETKDRFGGPNFIPLPDGELWGTSRFYKGGAKTYLGRMTTRTYDPVLKLPSGGDTSYAGMVWHDGLLWLSYYSSHEGKSSIYLAKVELVKDGNKSAQAIDIGHRLEMFVDDFLINKMSGAKQVVHRPAPRELVFSADRPWEGNTSAYFTLFQDGDLYRMYYRGSNHDVKANKATHPEFTCYAESKDGIHWTKPNLGLVEYAGSKENNILWGGPGTHNFTPFKDLNPKASPEARYKALASGSGGLVALKSADAIHWSLMVKKAVITKGAFDSQNLAFWDPTLGKYRDYHRAFRKVRDIMTCTSDDFLKWTEPVFLEYPGAPEEHLYTNAVQPYFRAPHILIGFPTRFLPAKQQVEPVFMASRDGKVFKRYGEAVIPRDAPMDRQGNRSNYMAWGVLELPGKKGELSVYGTEAYYAGPGSRLRRFSYRTDGFVSIQAKSDGGEVLLKPVHFKGDKLVVNFATTAEGTVKVELQDEKGQPIEGFSLADCKELKGDAIAHTVDWRGASLSKLAGRPVRLRFVMRDADLYSFRFQ